MKQRKYHAPAPAETIYQRILYVEELLRKGPILPGKLIANIKGKFKIQHRQARNYIAQARDRMLGRLDQKRAEHRADSLAFYQGIVVSKSFSVSTKDRIHAQERIDKLLGLECPSKVAHEHSGTIRKETMNLSQLNVTLDVRRTLLNAVRQQQLSNGTPQTPVRNLHPEDADVIPIEEPIPVYAPPTKSRKMR